MTHLDRRDVLKLGALGGAALILPIQQVAGAQLSFNRLPTSRFPAPFTIPFVEPPVLGPVRSDATTDYFDIDQRMTTLQIMPGIPPTRVFAYNGSVPGPTLYVNHGRPAVVRVRNNLPTTHPYLSYQPWTSTHLHGSASKPQYDGYASDITRPGQYKDYRYPNLQQARSLWYHDHGVHHTAENVYMGLAGMYCMHDPQEQTLPIPQGRYDVPLIIRDAIFATDGSLIFDTDDVSSLSGDVILVNGKPWPRMAVERRKYRFRILNASISRGLHLRLSTGEPFAVVGHDGGLAPAPKSVSQFKIGSAERYEVVIDFAKYRIGQRVVLRNLGVKNSVNYSTTANIMAFDVVSDATDTTNNTVPAVLNPNEPTMALTPAMATKTRRLRFRRSGGEWTIDGKTWQDVVDSRYRAFIADPDLNAVEIWEMRNESGGWFHPVHIHLIDFQILARRTFPDGPWKPPFDYERGPKDVVYISENEEIRVIARFGPEPGRYMIHCHNLVHEDHDMMHQLWVGGSGAGPDPILADPAKPLPAPPL